MTTSVCLSNLEATATVVSGFAHTKLVQVFTNESDLPQTETLSSNIPLSALVTALNIRVDGALVHGYLKDKAEAKKLKDKRKIVSIAANDESSDTKVLGLEVLLPARSTAQLELQYEHLLERESGLFRYCLDFPGSQSYRIRVHIIEQRPIEQLFVPELSSLTGERSNTQLKEGAAEQQAFVSKRSETLENDTKVYLADVVLAKDQEQTDAQFVLLYDIKRTNLAGHLLTCGDTFAHFLTPIEWQDPIGRRNVIFVVEASDSMLGVGSQLRQVQRGLLVAIGRLHQSDLFNVISFGANPNRWQHHSQLATDDNKRDALHFVSEIRPRGNANLEQAICMALEQLQKTIRVKPTGKPILIHQIVLVTQCRPTSSGNPAEFLHKVRRVYAQYPIALYCLAFGTKCDWRLLRRLTARCRGWVRRVLENERISEALQELCRHISEPVLTNVKLDFGSDADEQYHSLCPLALYSGTEMLTVGRLANPQPNKNIVLREQLVNRYGPQSRVLSSAGFVLPSAQLSNVHSELLSLSAAQVLERIWAHVALRQSLERLANIELDVGEQKIIKQKALEIATKYSYLCAITALIVELDNDQDPIIYDSTMDTASCSSLDAFSDPLVVIINSSTSDSTFAIRSTDRESVSEMPPTEVDSEMDPYSTNTRMVVAASMAVAIVALVLIVISRYSFY